MIQPSELHLRYLTDEKGEKQAVVLPIAEFEELIEDLEDLAAAAERRNEPTVSHEELLTRLAEDGYL